MGLSLSSIQSPKRMSAGVRESEGWGTKKHFGPHPYGVASSRLVIINERLTKKSN